MTRKSIFVGGLLTLVLTAAVVGGSFAIFTDTESMHVKFEAGTIDIKVNGEEGYQEFFLKPDGSSDWKPGDHYVWPIDIYNKGNNKAWIQVYVYPTGPWDGVKNFWDVATYKLDGPEGMWGVDPWSHLDLTLTVDFPQSVNNDYQGAQADLLILVVAKQWRHKAEEGYSCIALENKDTTTWLPVLNDEIEGVVCVKPGSGTLDVEVNAYGLIPDKYYQLTLGGPGGCTSTDDGLANSGLGPNYYVRGYYNGNPALLEPTCGTPGQGVYNYAGAEATNTVQADASGSISHSATITLPPGAYSGVSYVIKHDEGAPPVPTGPWTGVLMEMASFSFTIP
jgi:predicted ribosomally synthesized peptide with SipW-like signal peptide